ncbi:MAG TPA: hypothetical protein VGI81_14260 [Tepidisphaeraceae bacterium]|jgi:hypothetical protein
MPARTKRRAKFDFRGRPFVWWIDGDKYLRIASLDKRFVIAHPLGTAPGDPPTVAVIGPEFPGLDPADQRPVWFTVPRPAGTVGAWVDQLLSWSFDSAEPRTRLAETPRFL